MDHIILAINAAMWGLIFFCNHKMNLHLTYQISAIEAQNSLMLFVINDLQKDIAMLKISAKNEAL